MSVDRLHELHNITITESTTTHDNSKNDTDIKDVFILIEQQIVYLQNHITAQIRISRSHQDIIKLEQQLAQINNNTLNIFKQTIKHIQHLKSFSESQVVHKTQQKHLLEKLRLLYETFQKQSTETHQVLRARQQRILQRMHPHLPAQDMEVLLDSGTENIIRWQQQFVMASTEEQKHATLFVEQTVDAIERRHLAVLQLEQQILEIQELFRDLAILVDLQGQSLDTVERHIQHANNNVEHGAINLEAAAEYQQKARKRRCCLLIICLCILLVIILPIILTLRLNTI